jgi:23S rRNA pseudouridine1911/1915/1917 synthase
MASTLNTLQILFEDNHFIIVNKQSGDLVQGDKTGDAPLSDLIKSYLKEKYLKPGAVFLGVAHRLDRPTTGVVVFAKTSKALERFNKMLRENKVAKTYWAIVKNKPEKAEDTLTSYLKKNPKNNKSTSFNSEIEGSKKAVLHYKLIKSLENYHLLEVDLETGRHHQIRCQLAAIGCPIKGDLKYGFDRSNKDASIHLHAHKIEFIHPVTNELISILAPTPNDSIWDACN